MDLSNEIGVKICEDLGINPNRIISIDISINASTPIPTIIIKVLPMSNDWLTDFSCLKNANITVIENGSILRTRVETKVESLEKAESDLEKAAQAARGKKDKKEYHALIQSLLQRRSEIHLLQDLLE